MFAEGSTNKYKFVLDDGAQRVKKSTIPRFGYVRQRIIEQQLNFFGQINSFH